MASHKLTPAISQKRLCGICNKALSVSNIDDICRSHNADSVMKYREKKSSLEKDGRALISFLKETHGAGTVVEILAEGRKLDLSPRKRKAANDLEKYPEALCLLRVTATVFRYTLPVLLRKVNTAAKKSATIHKKKVSRDVLCYLMSTKLGMNREDIATIMGFAYQPVVDECIKRISSQLLEDEDIILAVDLVHQEYDRRYEDEMSA